MADSAPRVLVVSQRRLRPTVCRASYSEFEDVIASVDDVDLVVPPVVPSTLGSLGTISERVASKLGVHIESLRKPQKVALRDRYDLLFVVVQHPSDLSVLDGCPGWRGRCRKAIVYLDELYPVELQYVKMLEPLKQFDFVVSNCYETNLRMKERFGINAVYGALAADAIRFCPLPKNPRRVIDFLSVGRRSQKTHAALLEMARTRDFFYEYDTYSPKWVSDPRDHREMFAARAVRARYFLANKPQVDNPAKTAGHENVGLRFYEAIATGTVMVGEPPLKAVKWHEHFGYEDACVRLPWESTDVAALIDELDAQPDRVARARHANVMNSLTRHDWAYRWRQILELAELPELPRLAERFARLKQLADEADRILKPRGRVAIAV